MSIRQIATDCRWLTGAIVFALCSFATAQAQDAAPQALTFTVIHDFAGATLDGDSPFTALTPVGDGSYYGTTGYGGGNVTCTTFSPGCGTVFKLESDGSETVLFNFTGGASGSVPEGALISDPQGNLYGTTHFDGDLDCSANSSGCGVVFKLAPDGSETVLHTFSGTDGASPKGRLVRDTQGNLYGTTQYGGNPACSIGKSCGVVFKLAPDGTYTRLHAFNGSDGAVPNGDLIRDRAGDFYGTTLSGGGFGSDGVVFKMKPNGTSVVLHAFTGGTDGLNPEGGLVSDGGGNLYGTTAFGGSTVCLNQGFPGCGTVFKIAPDGTETILYAFQGGSDGINPGATLYRNRRTGALYGTTSLGGANGLGTVFVVKPDGSEQVLHTFAGSDGASPGSSLIRGQGAQLIGTTTSGGAYNHGVIYSLQISQ